MVHSKLVILGIKEMKQYNFFSIQTQIEEKNKIVQTMIMCNV